MAAKTTNNGENGETHSKDNDIQGKGKNGHATINERSRRIHCRIEQNAANVVNTNDSKKSKKMTKKATPVATLVVDLILITFLVGFA